MVPAVRVLAVALACACVLAPRAAAQTTTYTSTETIPVPPASNYAGVGGGDGWDVSLSDTQVFNVFHHNGSLTVACHAQSDGSECYPARTITDSAGTGFRTSSHSGTHLDRGSGHLLVYATRTDNTAGVVCVDTVAAAGNPNPFCGFTALTAVGDGGATSVPMKVGNRLYAFNYVNGAQTGDRDRLLCFDTAAGAACAGQPFDAGVSAGIVANGTSPAPATASIGGRIIVPITTDGVARLACWDTATGAPCAGSWPADPGPGYVDADNGSPFPLLDSDGVTTGVCLPTGANPCFSLAGAPVATPAGMVAALGSTTSYNGQAVTIGARTYLISGDTDTVRCYNAATATACANFPKPTTGASYTYTLNRDPQRPTCLWVNSDNGPSQIQNLDAFTAGPCGRGSTRVLSEQLVAPDKRCEPAAYRRFEVLEPERSSYTDGTIGFADVNGEPPGIADRTLDGGGAVDLTGIGLEQVDRPQFLITLNGAQRQATEVVVRLTWEGTYDPACLGDGVEAAAPAASPPAPAPAAPAPAGGVLPQVASSAPCTSKRFFRITLRKRRGRIYRSARITVNGTPVKVRLRRGRPTTRVDLRRFGMQTIHVRITARVKGGRTLKGKRTYHPCSPRKRSGKPPRL